MCIGVPMRIVSVDGLRALCEREGERRHIDLSLVGPQPAGTWVLTFLDAAREVLSAQEAQRIDDALKALGAVMDGEQNIDHLFADLVDREPQLPEHLRPLAAATPKAATGEAE